MNSYLNRKPVRAARIRAVPAAIPGASHYKLGLVSADPDADFRIVSSGWMRQNRPEVDGYLVEREDGRAAFVPAAAFEAAYAPLPEEPAA